jgi:hypothetical protein
MDEDRLTVSFRDEIGLAIEAATSVTPAPGLAAAVRARVDRERARRMHWITWQLAVACGLIFVIASGVVLPRLRDVKTDMRGALIAATHLNRAAPLVEAVRPLRRPTERSAALRVTAQARTPAPDRLSDQAIALRDYVASLRHVRIDLATVSAMASTSRPLEFPAITIERIAIDPLPRLEAVTGERR